GGGRPAERNRLADLDLGIGGAGVVLLLCQRGRGQCHTERENERSRRPQLHGVLPKSGRGAWPRRHFGSLYQDKFFRQRGPHSRGFSGFAATSKGALSRGRAATSRPAPARSLAETAAAIPTPASGRRG